MAAPDITLNKGQLLVTKSGSGLGIFIIGNTPYSFGSVEKVSDLSSGYVVGASILFNANAKETASLMYGSTVYFLVNEKDVTGTEVIPP